MFEWFNCFGVLRPLPAAIFGCPRHQLSELNNRSMFAGSSQTWFETESIDRCCMFGDISFWSSAIQYIRLVGRILHRSSSTWESVPLGIRQERTIGTSGPIYQNMVFTRCSHTSLAQTQCLKIVCLFGVTWVETTEDVADPNWNYRRSSYAGWERRICHAI